MNTQFVCNPGAHFVILERGNRRDQKKRDVEEILDIQGPQKKRGDIKRGLSERLIRTELSNLL